MPKKDKVKVCYTGKLEFGKVINQTKDGLLMVFQIWGGVVLYIFVKALMDIIAGGKKDDYLYTGKDLWNKT